MFEDEVGAQMLAQAGGLAGYLGRQQGLVLMFPNGRSTEDQVRRLRGAGVKVVVATPCNCNPVYEGWTLASERAPDRSWRLRLRVAGGAAMLLLMAGLIRGLASLMPSGRRARRGKAVRRDRQVMKGTA